MANNNIQRNTKYYSPNGWQSTRSHTCLELMANRTLICWPRDLRHCKHLYPEMHFLTKTSVAKGERELFDLLETKR